MSLADLASVVDTLRRFFAFVGGMLANALLAPASDTSLASLASAFLIAAVFISWKRVQRRKRLRLRVLLRAMFPRRWLIGRSARTDIGFFLFNIFVAGVLLGWAVLSYHMVSKSTNGLLVGVFGALSPTTLPYAATMLIMTVALFLAYELGYWVDHYLSHTVPFLWEFHKVHHSAETLSPLTNSRIHPVNGVIFVNILALFMGTTEGVLNYLFGKPLAQYTISGANLIIVVMTYLLAHLHHTHVWLPLTGLMGRIVISPAHHQIHHSTNPLHFNKNLGSCLAVYDWLFGTLHIPAKEREKLTFGVDAAPGTKHTFAEELIDPFRRAAGVIQSSVAGPGTPASEAPPATPQAR